MKCTMSAIFVAGITFYDCYEVYNVFALFVACIIFYNCNEVYDFYTIFVAGLGGH